MEWQIVDPLLGLTIEWRVRIDNVETSKGHYPNTIVPLG
jgi:hypothetical protein